jgi:hypothetical protein
VNPFVLSERELIRGELRAAEAPGAELARIERAAALVRDQSALLRGAFLDAWIRTYAASIGAGSEPGSAAVLAAGAVIALNQYLQSTERKP